MQYLFLLNGWVRIREEREDIIVVTNPKNPLAEREMFFCEALYECNSAAIKKRSDEIIVVGFSKLKVQEELAIFSAGAQQN